MNVAMNIQIPLLKNEMSAFRKIGMPSNFEVIVGSPGSPSQLSDKIVETKKPSKSKLEAEDVNSSRSWTEKATKYVLLKYFYWKYTEPQVMSFHETYKHISASVALDMGIRKTSTQIRDKINNIKSGFKKDKKAVVDSFGTGVINLKYVSPALYDIMDKYFDEEKVKNFGNILKEINSDITELLH